MNKIILNIAVAAVFSATSATAQTCGTAPTCESLGYTSPAGSCNGGYLSCPFEMAKVACLTNAPKIGDLKYSLYASNHDGWLKCDGTQYNSTTYSKLFSVISTNFCHKYTSRTDTAYGTNNCKGGYFAVPDYRGFFLRVAGSYNIPSNTIGSDSYYFSDALKFKGGSSTSSIYVPQFERLPNITGTLNDINAGSNTNVSGAFYATGGSFKRNPTNAVSGGFGFQASRSNIIYDGTNVIPANYGAYVYIYAGR